MKIVILLIATSLLCVACNSKSMPDNSIKESPVPVTKTETETAFTPETESYAVSIEAPQQVKANENYTISSSLLNLEDDSVRVQIAASIFYFAIRDSNGRQINTFGMHNVGKMWIHLTQA
ncbi:hypothetical protein [Paenibacillus macerans]|uniref:hypothetical protein n=1 Tax=Paenibacillus macerans TaxID=44252 RepID=UPI003D31CBE8